MRNIEMRWKVPSETTTKPPVLQYRTLGEAYEVGDEIIREWSQWEDVPLVVVDEIE